MMEFVRTGRSYSPNIGYRLDYERSSQENTVIVDLEVFPVRPSEEHRFEITVPDSVEVTKYDEIYTLKFRFDQLDEGWVEIKNPANTNPQASIKLEIPETKIFLISESILEDGEFGRYEDWIDKNLSDQREGYHLLNFRAKSEKILKFKDHIQVLSFLADQHPRVSNVIADNFQGYFKNRILNGSEPHSITSFKDLAYKIDLYNEEDFQRSINYNDVLRDTLEEIYDRQRNSGYSYVSHLLDRILTTETADLQYLSRDVIGLYLSCLVRAGQLDLANDLFTGWATGSRPPEGQYSEKISRLEGQLRQEGASRNTFAEYLYYLGRNEIVEGYNDQTFPLFECGFEKLDSSTQLATFAEFWARMRQGDRELNEDDSKAREAFDEALSIIEDTESEGEKIETWRRRALSGKYQAIVNDYEAESGAETAIEYLNHFIEDDLSELNTDSKLHHRVEALRHDLISKENIRNSAVDLATDNLEEAVLLYSKAGMPKQRARMFARQKQLEALLDEINLRFDQAGEKYETVSEIYSEALGEGAKSTRFEDIAYICYSKSHLLDKEAEDAVEYLHTISGYDDEVAEHAADLSTIATQLKTYRQGDVSIASQIESSGPVAVKRVDGLLLSDFELDKTKIINYSAQYLRQYGFSVDVLDSIVDIALEDSFAPKPREVDIEYDRPESDREKDLLLSISLDEVWQSKLPAHIHYQIEKMKIQKISIAGDYSSLLKELTTTLEVLLVVVSEYYSKIVYGGVHEDISPIDEASLGDLMSFVQKLPEEELAIAKDLKKEFLDDDLPGDMDISEIRNAGSHGSQLTATESEYEKTENKLIGLFRKIAPYSPVIVEVEDKSQFGPCICILHWGGLKKRVWINTNDDLNIGELYYVPSEKLEDDHIVEVQSESITKCEAKRAKAVTDVLGDLDPDMDT